MNEKSPKNRLIEYASKNKISTPIFETVRQGGSDHNPIFKTKLTFLDNILFSSGYGKKQAELNASLDFLNKVQLEEGSELYEWKISIEDLKYKCKEFELIILYDGDNLEHIPSGTEHTLQIVFVSNSKSVLNRFRKIRKHINVYIVICPVNGQDANDHYLTFIYGGLRMIYPNKTYSIVSEDHFGSIVSQF
jgi:hypothetical protein